MEIRCDTAKVMFQGAIHGPRRDHARAPEALVVNAQKFMYVGMMKLRPKQNFKHKVLGLLLGTVSYAIRVYCDDTTLTCLDSLSRFSATNFPNLFPL